VKFAPKNYADARDNAAKVIFATFVAHQIFFNAILSHCFRVEFQLGTIVEDVEYRRTLSLNYFKRRRNVNLSELPQTALFRTGISTTYRSDHELEAGALMRIWIDSIKVEYYVL
jgi:hypothetical protein